MNENKGKSPLSWFKHADKHQPAAAPENHANASASQNSYEKTTVLMKYDPNFHRFQFDSSVWEEQFLLGHPALAVTSETPGFGKYATLPLNAHLQQGKQYLLDVRFKVKTTAEQLNLHVKDSNSKHMQVVHSCNLSGKNDGMTWIDVSIPFVANSSAFDEFVIGASQVCGKGNYIIFHHIVLDVMPSSGSNSPQAGGRKPAPTAAKPAVSNDDVEKLHSNPEFIKIRILATLLKDYGIKHIVLSPGGRDVPLVRMFEYNEGTFTIHRVTDERSAAYFGLGIAAQLQQPVVCVCTSGTAASNYLPAVTEAYYTGVPLIMITADRKEVFLNHGEDQTIPQKHIYNGVVKKEISIPEATGFHAEYQTRRDISECILETTHNGFGPVHINMAIDNIGIGAQMPRECWKLLPRIEPHLLRVGPCDGEAELMKWVNALKKSSKILVVYGQNAYPNKKQLDHIQRFASKFNCVIVTDHISNLDCKYALKPYNMLQAISQKEFNDHLSPDILITVGGKRLMNDPLTSKVRRGFRNIRHWGVTPDGKVKDFYFKETSVIEMSQDYFFEWFADHAGKISNDGVYLNRWKQYAKQYPSPVITKFNSYYVQSKFLPAVPGNSVLHLGVGQSFFDCRKFTIDSTVDVFCNMGTNGIDGCTSTFMGQCAVVNDKLCFLLVGDLSFFYDMNGIWNKDLKKNIRILMVNNNGSGLLRGNNLKAITSVHNTKAEHWVKSVGFEYMSAHSPSEYEEKLPYFVSQKPSKAVFFEVFCD